MKIDDVMMLNVMATFEWESNAAQKVHVKEFLQLFEEKRESMF